MTDTTALRALAAFKRGAGEAPSGSHVQATALHEAIGDALSDFMRALRALGLQANACDLAFEVEGALYDYAKKSNPQHPMFENIERFGREVDGPDRLRALQQAVAAREAFVASRGPSTPSACA